MGCNIPTLLLRTLLVLSCCAVRTADAGTPWLRPTTSNTLLSPCCPPQIEECSLPQGGRSPDPTSKHLGAVSVLVLSMLVEEPDSPMLRRDVSNLCGKQWSSGDVANAEALEAGLRAAGHDPLLTAADQEQLVLLLLPYAARYMSGTRQPPQLTAMLRPSAVDATRRLVLQEPGSALLKNLHAFMVSMDPRQSAQGPAAYRDALQAAQATKCECARAGVACCGGRSRLGLQT